MVDNASLLLIMVNYCWSWLTLVNYSLFMGNTYGESPMESSSWKSSCPSPCFPCRVDAQEVPKWMGEETTAFFSRPRQYCDQDSMWYSNIWQLTVAILCIWSILIHIVNSVIDIILINIIYIYTHYIYLIYILFITEDWRVWFYLTWFGLCRWWWRLDDVVVGPGVSNGW